MARRMRPALTIALEKQLDRVLRQDMRALEAQARSRVVREALQAGDIERAVDAAIVSQRDKSFVRTLTQHIAAGMRTQAMATRRALRAVAPADIRISVPEIRDAAATRAGDHIVEIRADQRAAVRRTIARAFDEGLDARTVQMQVVRIVGLHSRYEEAVARFLEDLRSRGDPDASRRAAEYAQELKRARALTIARTEAHFAVQRGRELLIEKALQARVLSKRDQRVWSTARDELVCPICGPLDGVRVSLDETFVSPLGDTLRHPPAHPNCRCDIDIRIGAGLLED